MLRILHISTRLILGGSQENTVLSCEGQARLGHEVHLAFGPIYGPEGSLLERVQRFATADGRGITTHVVGSLCREVSPIRDVLAVREVRRLIERVRPDVVHTHSSKAGIVGRLAGWQVACATARADQGTAGGAYPAVVHTIHGPPFMPVEGGAIKRLKRRVGNAVYTLAERAAAARCHAVVSVADAMTAQFLARGIGTPGLYTTVRSGIELGPYLHPGPTETRSAVRGALGLGEGAFVVATVARLAEHKGHEEILAAVEALGRKGGQVAAWRLLWVGDGWWRERLTARARAAGLAVVDVSARLAGVGGGGGAGEGDAIPADRPAVLLTGLVPPERVPALVRAADVLCHPSAREGLPRVVPQALLCGVMPVATDVDGTREACIDGVTGKLVPLGDVGALAAALAWAAEHPAERAALAAAGKRMAEEQFSAEAMVRGLEGVYGRAVEGLRGG
ncbi:MAG: glycosyltransferase [bacterium]